MNQENLTRIPDAVADSIKKLQELVQKYPQFIPLPECATFLGMDRDGLRRAIETNTCPFGIAWQRPGAANRAFKIPTATFYFWYTKGFSVAA
jgi:hypothetical protein